MCVALLPPLIFSFSSTKEPPGLNLSTPFLVACLRHGQPLNLPPLSGELFFNIDKGVLEKQVSRSKMSCLMSIDPPVNLFLKLEFTQPSRLRKGPLQFVVETNDLVPAFDSDLIVPNWDRRMYITLGARVWFRLKLWMQRSEDDLFLAFNFTFISSASLPRLEMGFYRPRLGFIQSPGFNGYKKYLLGEMSRRVTVTLPHRMLTMISMAYIHLGSLILCLGGKIIISTSSASKTICGDIPSRQFFIPSARLFFVHFEKKTTTTIVKGFRLLFSFHDESRRLPILANGWWNCTVASWPEYRHHFPCDLRLDCLDGADEALCPYTSSRCRRGYFLVADRCYSLVELEGHISWNSASVMCRLDDGYLVSFNSLEEWEDILAMLMTYVHTTNTLIGLRSTSSKLPPIYRYLWHQADGSIAYYLYKTPDPKPKPICLTLLVHIDLTKVSSRACDKAISEKSFICENDPRDSPNDSTTKKKAVKISSYNSPLSRFDRKQFVKCPQGHLTHGFLACEGRSNCWVQKSTSCSAPMTPLPPSFACRNGLQRVPYNVVCDFRSDCNDNSDENFCTHPQCLLVVQFKCWNEECVNSDKVFNQVTDCMDGSDEMQCSAQVLLGYSRQIRGPAYVNFTDSGPVDLVPISSQQEPSNTSEWCPANFFACHSLSLCLPVYTRCNQVYDCPGREDEAECGKYTCPGLYRCRGSSVCLTHKEVCDGRYHCPMRDDELVCDLTCPQNCMCQGPTFFCHRLFDPSGFPSLRFLDASRSGLQPDQVANNTMLVLVSLARCGLKEFGHLALPNLHILDLNDNMLSEVINQHLSHLPNLKHLSLAGNPIVSVFRSQGRAGVLTSPDDSMGLHSLDLSRVLMTQFCMADLGVFPSLKALNLSGCGVDTLHGSGAQAPGSLRVLDVRGCPLTHFQPDLFQNLLALEELYADNYKLCCPQMLPMDFNLASCRAPSDEVSSCQNLLHSTVYRVFLALIAGLALLGNLVVFMSRVVMSKTMNGFQIFTIILCISDFLMGIYLVIIGMADWIYKGSYLWNDFSWRHSIVCSLAGFLSMVSNEVSAFIVCLITLDRFLVLRFLFSRVRFSKKGGIVISAVVLLVGVILAAVPLFPSNANWQFYSVYGICVPLPITRKDFPGHRYSFSLLIVFNFILFLLIALGQILIFHSVQKNSMRFSENPTSSITSAKYSNVDLILARRLIVIAFTDFVCWFPIGLLGFLASNGVSISGEVNVAIAIFVLPLNSALNPFLYTINRLLENRRVEREQRLMKQLLARVKLQASMEAHR